MNLNNIKDKILKHIVTIVFIILCTVGFIASGQSFSYIFSEVGARFFRNFGLVFALIIPVVAGVGLNFGIVLGAMAAQTSLIIVTYYNIQGTAALMIAGLISVPLATLLGWLLAQLFNRTKGQEMITGMIAGYFANGIYQLIFMVFVGTIIPISGERIISYTGIGIIDTLRLEKSVAGALDNIFKIKTTWLAYGVIFFYALAFLGWYWHQIKVDGNKKRAGIHTACYLGLLLIAALVCTFNKSVSAALGFTKIPVVPLLLTALFGLTISFILQTKLGQDFRAAGMDLNIAAAAGINVNRTRTVAIIISTIFAAFGQIIFLQNIGNFTTYSSHEKVGLFAVASILVGGASIRKATVKQAVIGTLLFHTLFVIAPLAGKSLLNDAAYGEYFREAISYGVIAIALVLHITGHRKKTAIEDEITLVAQPK